MWGSQQEPLLSEWYTPLVLQRYIKNRGILRAHDGRIDGLGVQFKLSYYKKYIWKPT